MTTPITPTEAAMREARAQDVIAKALQSALAGDGTVNNVPQTMLAERVLTALSSAGLAVVPVDTALLTEADLIKVRDLADELHVAFKETDKERFTAGELAAVKISALMFSRVLQAGVRAGERARAAALPPLASGGG